MLQRVSLPIQLLLVLGIVILFGHKLPPQAIQMFYTLSLIFKECLGFLLPFMIFSFITTGIMSFQKNTPLIITVLLFCVLLSNGLTPLISYFVSSAMLTNMTSNIIINQLTHMAHTQPLFNLYLPRLMSAEIAIVLAVITGIYLSHRHNTVAENIIEYMKSIVEWIITNMFIPILPLYVFGFLAELHAKGVFFELFQSYGKTYALIITLQFTVIFGLYLLASGFTLTGAMTYINNALPSYLTAFGTMSSTAAIPVTIQCATKNTDNKPLAQVATPILANIHMTGDAVTVPVLAIVTLYLFQGIIPNLTTFMTFVAYYSATMLGASGIPGGAVIVMIPILKSILGFTDDMISIMMTLHLLQDGFGTGGNVMGDGALMIIIDKILKKIGIR